MKHHAQFLSVILIVSISIMMAPAMPGSAGSTLAACYVAPGGDNNQACTTPGTACETIQGALDKAGCSDVIFVASGTYTDTSTEVVRIKNSIALSGGWDASFSTPSGTSTIDGENARRGIVVEHGVSTEVYQFTIINGEEDSGAGIFNEGVLTLVRSIVRDNIDIGDWTSEGGGIRNGSQALYLIQSTVMDNQSSSGAGIFNAWGDLVINNSTISGNSARGTGGGINNLGGEVYLNNTTISNNIDNTDSGFQDASGIHNEAGGSVELKNTIIAGNIGQDCDGTLTSSGYNLIEDGPQCSITAMPGDQINVDPRLGILQNNGGLTATHALLFGSPAINAGNPDGCQDHQGSPLNYDQRGFPRVQDCDIGAFEFQTYIYEIELPIVIKTEQ